MSSRARDPRLVGQRVTTQKTVATHDIIVIGGSAGGLQALSVLLRGLPAELPAAVFAVLHIGATSHLASILQKNAGLRVCQAKNGDVIEHGTVYVAVPDTHLLVHDDHLLLRRGPRENLSRPAIDPLFRSAALTFGSRVIGVILSGALDDGTAGLRAIKRCGGLAVVQDPTEAAVHGMPASALRAVDVDYVSSVADMAELLGRLNRELAGPSPEPPFEIRLEAAIAAQEIADMAADDQLGTPSRFTCPECHGALWEIEDGSILRYRCHTGHAFTADSVIAAQSAEIDNLIGVLFRSHQERAALMHRMSEKARADGRHDIADLFVTRARDYEASAEMMRRIFVSPPEPAGDAVPSDVTAEEDGRRE